MPVRAENSAYSGAANRLAGNRRGAMDGRPPSSSRFLVTPGAQNYILRAGEITRITREIYGAVFGPAKQPRRFPAANVPLIGRVRLFVSIPATVPKSRRFRRALLIDANKRGYPTSKFTTWKQLLIVE